MYYFLLSTSTTKKTIEIQNEILQVKSMVRQVVQLHETLYLCVCYSAFNASKTYEQGQRLGAASEIRCIKCDIYGRLPVTVKYITSLQTAELFYEMRSNNINVWTIRNTAIVCFMESKKTRPVFFFKEMERGRERATETDTETLRWWDQPY